MSWLAAGCVSAPGLPPLPPCGGSARGDVVVLGVVVRPGTIPFRTDLTVADAVAAAGGLLPAAVRDPTRLQRVHGNRSVQVVVRDADWAAVPLCPGDRLHLPERPPL